MKTKISDLEEFNFRNDHLIVDSLDTSLQLSLTIKDLKKERWVFGDVLNIFSALIKAQDFTKKLTLHQTPYIKSTYIKEFILQLPDNYLNDHHLRLRRILSKYVGFKTTMQWKHYKEWFYKNNFPLVFVRVLARIYSVSFNKQEQEVLKKIIPKITELTDSRNQKSFNPPLTLPELCNPILFYLMGISAGDGCNLASGERWDVTDGHKNLKFLKYSHQHITNIKEMVFKNFKISGTVVDMPGNKYTYRLDSKWFCRYIHFFLDVPFGRKGSENLTKPSILDYSANSTALEASYWRGFIDSDGQIMEKSANVQIETTNLSLMRQLHLFLAQQEMKPTFATIENTARIFLPVESYLKYATVIGSWHPLKRKIMESHLIKGPSEKKCFGLKKEFSNGDPLPFGRLTSLTVHNCGEVFKLYREKHTLSKRDIAIRTGLHTTHIRAWENNKIHIPFDAFLFLFGIEKETKGYAHLLNKLTSKKEIRWSYKRGTAIWLPQAITQELIDLASKVRPTSRGLYVVRKPKENEEQVKKFFNLEHKKRISSTLLCELFEILFDYKKPWEQKDTFIKRDN